MNTTILEDIGMLFYIVNPTRTSFEAIDEVPDYPYKIQPYFVLLFFIEQIFLYLTRRRTGRFYDVMVCLGNAYFLQVINILFHGGRLMLYCYIYENWRIATLPWNSIWIWWIGFFAADFAHYWGHRAMHEVNILWAAHQVHHSSEDFNVFVSIRQSIVQYYLLPVLYLPFALAIPPSVCLVHQYLNKLSQFWIHTEAIGKIGPLEYILNTASHHRVHHGKNPYCIDKNYGGYLIIWDRIFGTFQAEDEPVVYGLTKNIDSYSIFYIQFWYFKHIWEAFYSAKGWRNKMAVLLKGPNWSPGKPRLGNPEDLPEVQYPVHKYDPRLDTFQKLYFITHAILQLFLFTSLLKLREELPALSFYAVILFAILTIKSLSDFAEKKDCSKTELLRFMIFSALDVTYSNNLKTTLISPHILQLFRLLHLVSSPIWIRKVLKIGLPNFDPLKKRHDD